MKVGLYRNGLLLFDVEADPAERRNLADEHPDVVDRLQKLIDHFNATTIPGKPVMVSAAPADLHGWERMWMGIGLTGFLVFVFAVFLMYLCVRICRFYRSHKVK